MAARVMPFVASDQSISLTATDANPEGCILPVTTQNVTFTNNSGYSIDIAFNPPGIFAPVTGLSPTAPNNVNTQPAPTNVSVNYNVTVHLPAGPTTNGPYAIQAGSGAMIVTVSGNVGGETVSPDPVAIPAGGNLEMRPAISSNKYNVGGWTNGDPFTVPITTVDSTPHTDDPVNGGPGDYPFTTTRTSVAVGGGSGKGTVIVVST